LLLKTFDQNFKILTNNPAPSHKTATKTFPRLPC